MFRRLILFCSVVRFRPSRSAAPFFPDILPDAAFSASIITCRSASSKLEPAGTAARLDDALKLSALELCARNLEFFTLRQNHAPLDEVLKFANIAWPGGVYQRLHAPVWEWT